TSFCMRPTACLPVAVRQVFEWLWTPTKVLRCLPTIPPVCILFQNSDGATPFLSNSTPPRHPGSHNSRAPIGFYLIVLSPAMLPRQSSSEPASGRLSELPSDRGFLLPAR